MHTTPPVSFRDRVEFASRAWLAEAQRFLDTRLADAAGSIDDAKFELCEVHEDAPPHLNWPDNAASFHLQIDGSRALLSPGVVDDVDLKVRTNYNQVLAVATTVWGDDPTRRTRAFREHAHRYGPDALQVKGELPSSPVLRRVLDELHDHMARRTVPNPDLDHRIEHLGLARHRDELDTVGYTVLEGAVTEVFADEIRDALNRAIDESPPAGPSAPPVAARLLERGRVFEEAAQHPWVLALEEHLVGRGCLLAASVGFRKQPGQVTHQIHTDNPGIYPTLPPYCVWSTCIWALDDFDEHAGPTLIVPGSFRQNRDPADGEGEADLAPILMPKGSIALWHGQAWHSSAVRTAPGHRVSLHNAYARFFVRPLDGYLDIDPTILEANGPQLTTLCGLDDGFEKSTYSGFYNEGSAYAREHYMQRWADRAVDDSA